MEKTRIVVGWWLQCHPDLSCQGRDERSAWADTKWRPARSPAARAARWDLSFGVNAKEGGDNIWDTTGSPRLACSLVLMEDLSLPSVEEALWRKRLFEKWFRIGDLRRKLVFGGEERPSSLRSSKVWGRRWRR